MHSEFYTPLARIILILICVVGAGWSAALLVTGRHSDRTDRAAPGFTAPEFLWAHLFMLGAMAVMFGDSSGAIDASVWRWLFGIEAALLGLHIASLAVRRDAPARGERIGADLYHLLAAAAMIYALAGHTGDGMHHHYRHDSGTGTLPWPALAWVLAAIFAIEAIAVVAILAAGKHSGELNRDVAIATPPHLAMDVAMAAMLIGAVAG